VVLPELDPGVRVGFELVFEAERGPVLIRREDGAGGEVETDADHVIGAGACQFEKGRGEGAEGLDVIGGMLEGPVGSEAYAALGEGFVNDSMRVIEYLCGDFLSSLEVHEKSPGRFGSEIEADSVLAHLGC